MWCEYVFICNSICNPLWYRSKLEELICVGVSQSCLMERSLKHIFRLVIFFSPSNLKGTNTANLLYKRWLAVQQWTKLLSFEVLETNFKMKVKFRSTACMRLTSNDYVHLKKIQIFFWIFFWILFWFFFIFTA